MSKPTVFLVGATGETGSTILEALIEYGCFDITCFIRTSSANKPAVQDLKDHGLRIVTGDLSGPIEDTVVLLHGIDTVISIVFPPNMLDQILLINAAVQAGVKCFLPCNWGTPVARGGIMDLADLKYQVHDHMFRLKLPFTIVDVGNWYEQSYPRVPSGRFDYALMWPINDVYAGGVAPNMLTSKRDVGRFTAECINDERTLNKKVISYGEVPSQNQIHEIIERATGEKLQLTQKSAEEAYADLKVAREAYKADPSDISKMYAMVGSQYPITKYIRGDNSPENAEYLGYINGRDLYPDFEWDSFEHSFVNQSMVGTVKRPYPQVVFK